MDLTEIPQGGYDENSENVYDSPWCHYGYFYRFGGIMCEHMTNHKP